MRPGRPYPHPNGLTEVSRRGHLYVRVARDLHVSLTGQMSRFTDTANEQVRQWLARLPLNKAEQAMARRDSSIGGNWAWVTIPRRYEDEARTLLASLSVEHKTDEWATWPSKGR